MKTFFAAMLLCLSYVTVFPQGFDENGDPIGGSTPACRMWKVAQTPTSTRNTACPGGATQFQYVQSWNIAFGNTIPEVYEFVSLVGYQDCANAGTPIIVEESGCQVTPNNQRFWNARMYMGNSNPLDPANAPLDSISRTGCWGTCGPSPILIPLTPGGIANALTDVAGGVNFDLDSDGTPEHLAWLADGNAGWLALDRNGNGTIDNGRELFGNFTDQPASPNPNGFRALAEFDKPANGGNGDGVITGDDAVFDRLVVWRDDNHNGISECAEMLTLQQAGIVQIDLDYKEAKMRDRYGNTFPFRAAVRTASGAVQAYDVFLKQ